MIFFPNIESGYETACFLLFFTVFAATALCSAQNPNETRVVKDAAGRVKYTVHKTGNREIIKDSKGRITGTTRETKGTQILLQFKRLVGRYRNKMGTGKQTAEKSSYGKS